MPATFGVSGRQHLSGERRATDAPGGFPLLPFGSYRNETVLVTVGTLLPGAGYSRTRPFYGAGYIIAKGDFSSGGSMDMEIYKVSTGWHREFGQEEIDARRPVYAADNLLTLKFNEFINTTGYRVWCLASQAAVLTGVDSKLKLILAGALAFKFVFTDNDIGMAVQYLPTTGRRAI